MPDNITDWYGNNTIGWGESYKDSYWGNVNELNSWGIIYPNTAEGTVIRASSDNISSDTSIFTADNSAAGSVITFACSTANVTVQNGTTGATISLTDNVVVNEGTKNSISPTTYQSGSSTYTINIGVPSNSGYDNGGTNINCTTTATGSASGLPTSPGTLVTTRQQILASFDSTPINYIYNSVTYPGGFTDTLSVLRNLDGVTFSSGLGANFVQFDAVSPIVGSYVADGFGNFLSSSNMGNFGPYAAFSTPKYMRFAANVPLGSAGGFTNPFNAFPIHKVEQANGYIQITQIITS